MDVLVAVVGAAIAVFLLWFLSRRGMGRVRHLGGVDESLAKMDASLARMDASQEKLEEIRRELESIRVILEKLVESDRKRPRFRRH